MIKSRMVIAITAALAMVIACRVAALELGRPAPPFKLSDQFGKVWQTSDLANKVTVIVVATKNSGRAMGPWVDKLKESYGKKTQILGLLELKGIPSFVRGFTMSRIKKETSDPMMLDFDGPTATSYGVSDKLPTVVVIDKTYKVVFAEQAEYSGDLYKKLAAALDTALRAGEK